MLKKIKAICLSFMLVLGITLISSYTIQAQEDIPMGEGCFSGDTLLGIYYIDGDGYTVQYAMCRSAIGGIYIVGLDIY